MENNVGATINRRFNVFSDIIGRSVSQNQNLTSMSSNHKNLTGNVMDSSVITKFKGLKSNTEFRRQN